MTTPDCLWGAGHFMEIHDTDPDGGMLNRTWYVGLPYFGEGIFAIGHYNDVFPGENAEESACSRGNSDFVIDGDGNVGIGRYDPEAKLDVVGLTRTSGLEVLGAVDVSLSGDAALSIHNSSSTGLVKVTGSGNGPEGEHQHSG